MDIVCSFYYSSNEERQKEIERALVNNLSKSYINKYHIYITNDDYNRFINTSIYNNNISKIIIIKSENQPTYSDYIKYVCTIDNKICCICNSDIEFIIEDSNISLLDMLYNEKKCFFLTRHEYDSSYPLITNFGGSHDAFIFHSTVLKNSILDNNLNYINYVQNTWGIEALLTIYFIEKLNYQILNPCYQIKLIHHHKSDVRLWTFDRSRNKIIGYTSPTPNNRQTGIYNKHMIYPVKLSL